MRAHVRVRRACGACLRPNVLVVAPPAAVDVADVCLQGSVNQVFNAAELAEITRVGGVQISSTFTVTHCTGGSEEGTGFQFFEDAGGL